jgi:hypothetical protein
VSPTIRTGAGAFVAVLHKTVGSAWSLRKDDLKIVEKLPGLHELSPRFETKARKAFGIALISPAAIKNASRLGEALPN